MYTLYHETGSNTITDDPTVAIAHGKARGRRMTRPHDASKVPPLPRLTLPSLKDQLAEHVYQALVKSIANDDPRCVAQIGKVDEDGYWLAVTDGCRALMRAPDDAERKRFPAKTAQQFTPGPVRFVLNRPFAEVWRRMSVCANGWIDLTLTHGTLTLSARDEVGDTTTEVYPHVHDCSGVVDEPIRFTLNPTYLAPLLRFWPITVAYRSRVDGESDPPLVWSPAGVGWRYLVMPIRRK